MTIDCNFSLNNVKSQECRNYYMFKFIYIKGKWPKRLIERGMRKYV